MSPLIHPKEKNHTTKLKQSKLQLNKRIPKTMIKTHQQYSKEKKDLKINKRNYTKQKHYRIHEGHNEERREDVA